MNLALQKQYMSLPILNICDLFSREAASSRVAVHDLSELLKNDIFIPKRPHRHSFYQILFIGKGQGLHRIDFNNITFEGPVVFFLSPGQVHHLVFKDKEIEGYMINFSEDYFNEFLAKKGFNDELCLFKRNGDVKPFHPGLQLPEIRDILDKIASTYSKKPQYWFEKIRVYLLEFFYMAACDLEKTKSEENLKANQHILKRFEELIEKHFSEWHNPQTYANELSITANYLNAKCKTNSGMTAGQWIRNRLILEAKRLLVNSELSISEISYQLSFEDNSYFTKFFKSSTGMSPSDFRKSLNK